MAELFEVKEVDRAVYRESLADFLPARIIDAHTHVWRDQHTHHDASAFKRVVSWPALVAKDNTVEDLVEGYRLLFPGKTVTPLMFSSIYEGDDIHAMNAYVSECAASRGFPALIYAHPTWAPKDLEKWIRKGRFMGAKVYLNLAPAYIPQKEIRIFDFLPPAQLDVLHRNKWVAMLHIPRDGRLRDPVNLAQMLEIERNWPGVRLIIAHVGRAYCDEDMGDAFDTLKATKGMVFDFAANTNDRVFEAALRAFGPERCLFGSDMPITRMRMRRICEAGRYINIVPRGLYGDVSADKNMREVDPPEADRISFFMYEEVLAIKRAVERLGLGRSDVEAVFYANARRFLGI
jgi:predicted TIM-barrel fold metal-dependent hydrolase